jgi:uncharacterized protein (DUF1800 family)
VCRFYGTPGKGPNSHFYTASAAECAQVKNDPGWTYEGIAFFVNPMGAAGCPVGTTPVYRAYNNGYPRNDSNHRLGIDYSLIANMTRSGSSFEGAVMCSPLASQQIEADAIRLLEQVGFGPTDAAVAHVLAVGVSAYLEEQFAQPGTQYPPYPWVQANRPDSCVNNATPPITATSFCARDNYSLFLLQNQFLKNAIGNGDQLGQRTAWALSQILVTSGAENSINYAMTGYQQMLLDKAFGNFEDLLLSVTLSPMMGEYLNMVNNDKPDPVKGTSPNENFARELMQLFSIGLWKLNADGTQMLDTAGNPIPTYGLAEISGLAHAFTGWTYPTLPGQTLRTHNPRNYLGSMTGVESNHDTGSKLLLNGYTLPAGGSTLADVQAVVHNVFTHPNLGPFIGRQLIQKLVTSNPTPAYVARVTAAFNDNGLGVRGDMKAVLRAILTDPEARGDRKLDTQFGKLREPAVFLASLARMLNAQTDGVYLRYASGALAQNIFYSPTVFNYYAADNTLSGSNVLAPEFDIYDSASALNRSNVTYSLLYSTRINPDPNVYGAIGTTLDLTAFQAVASDANALADKLDRLLMHGTMSAEMRASIVNAVNAITASDSLNRARMGLYLVYISPQYQVER